jgi:L-amino acid N-acyltransferase YncA
MTIRPFQNADLPHLLNIWIQHWSAVGPVPEVNLAKFEQAVVSRQFFRPSDLLVAEDSGTVVGWIVSADSREEPQTTLVVAICTLPTADGTDRRLLDAAIDASRQSGHTQLRVGVIRDQYYGFAGLEPIGHGIAVPVADQRTSELLCQCGFEPGREVIQMLASTHGYRPPISREAMQYRRTAQVTSDRFVYPEPRQAAAMSHLDIELSRLIDRDGEVLAEIKLWYSDPEAEVLDPSTAILELTEAHQRGYLLPSESYLIGASLQTLERRRILTVDTAIDSDKSQLLEQLTALKFQPGHRGVQWVKDLN